MTAKVRAWARLSGCLALLAVLAPTAGPAPALGASTLAATAAAPLPSPSFGQEFVKFYVVTEADQGRPEGLVEIAARLLGATGRAAEIYHLNAGRRQPDGGKLTDGMRLRSGWLLVLPWDAVGHDVRYGVLPTEGAAAPSSPPTPVRTGADWAHDRMAVDQAWGRTHGAGILVAVVDSGVDADVPQLSGRVTVGADIPAGTERGNIDRLGSGTAMAGIVAAAPARPDDSRVVGLAPAAMILPLRVVDKTPEAKPTDAATAIEVAASAGARVITLGAYVDPTDEMVLDAVKSALAHDVVVVAPAPTVPVADAETPAVPKLNGLLLVGGVGPDGQPAANHRPDTVDVLAPGIDVASLGTRGSGIRSSSGTQYAAAFVAGAAALVRSAYPNLNATQVAHRIKATAEGAGQDEPDPLAGWGMINPNAAVTVALAAETPLAAAPEAGASPLRALTIGIVVVAGLAAVALLARRSPERIAEAVATTATTAAGARGAGAETSAAADEIPGADRAQPAAGPIGAPPAGAVDTDRERSRARVEDGRPGTASRPEAGPTASGHR
ncbi:hypothetical protein Vqi01_15260 [Micromonospora qiuiae]|uniref:Peptidase S8/S53 domain-containing protein n=1 Tax=Micromonospora qiuiae TaxID=502268 RepID=A0ABQ4J867_9ACTN|nr:S8 family serine peptidase [Micromonospora qiuiae]GIJ26364.1 hypothetical protein Vqi01_15260 [Micromonospora qiuiae]